MLDNLRSRTRNRLFHHYTAADNGSFSSGITRQPSRLDVHVSEEEFAQECLSSHNHFRAQHGCSPLHLSLEVSRFSQQWAERISQDNHLHHSHNPRYGENLFVTYLTDHSLPGTRGSEVVDSWYSEHSLFTCGERATRETLARAGHFTQLLWNSSRELGIGRAWDRGNRLYVVANYYPAGNVLKKLQENVPRRIAKPQHYHETSKNSCYSSRLYTKSTGYQRFRMEDWTDF